MILTLFRQNEINNFNKFLQIWVTFLLSSIGTSKNGPFDCFLWKIYDNKFVFLYRLLNIYIIRYVFLFAQYTKPPSNIYNLCIYRDVILYKSFLFLIYQKFHHS